MIAVAEIPLADLKRLHADLAIEIDKREQLTPPLIMTTRILHLLPIICLAMAAASAAPLTVNAEEIGEKRGAINEAKVYGPSIKALTKTFVSGDPSIPLHLPSDA